MSSEQIHIAHVVYSFATGGLENGMVNLINHLPEEQYIHSIICITDHDVEFIKRIKTSNYRIYDLHKPPGRGLGWLYRCWKLLRQLKPDICHSRNLNPLEAQIAAFLAGIKHRIHGEHGWDTNDLGGTNVKYQKLRKILKPLIHRYIALSTEAFNYLTEKINVPANKVSHICNGVNVDKFNVDNKAAELPKKLRNEDAVIFGTVGRLAEVKNQMFLLNAFIDLKEHAIEQDTKSQLLIVGDGVLMPELKNRVEESGFSDDIYLTGLRADIPELMAAMNVFVLPSLAEGISNTILEAMASGLPVIATDVGGNPDLIMPEHQTSHLVTVNNVTVLREAMEIYSKHSDRLPEDSGKTRAYCVNNFSIQAMVSKYHALYESLS